MKFNPGQEAAVERAVSGFLEKDLKGLTIIGEGGTGKTTCVMAAADRWLHAGLKVLFTAPTNKAVKQLEKSAKAYGLVSDEMEFKTLHSALGLALLPSEENMYPHKLGNGVFSLYDIAVVDEVSMLGKRALFDYLLPDAAVHNVQLLFMGDDMQLPPVKEKKSPAFEVFETIRLTQVERQAGDSGILALSGLLRTAIDTNRPFLSPETCGNGVTVIKTAEFLKHVVDAFDADTDLDDQRVLAWSNRRVDDINRAIRQKIYGKGAARYEVGERVVTGGPIGTEGVRLLSTDEECIVHSVIDSSVEDEDSGESFNTLMLVLNPLHSPVKQVFAHVLHKDDQARFDARLAYLAEQARKVKSESRRYWARFHKFKGLFADIRYCYCITVHRSQGSTYKRTFVDVVNILENKTRTERQSLLYVGYSRSSLELCINKSKYVA